MFNQLAEPFACPSPSDLVYFDTNVFDPEHGIVDAQKHLLDGALYRGEFRIVAGLDCFIEPLLVFESGSDIQKNKASIQIQRIMRWCDLRRIVKPAEQMLIDNIVSYAETGQPAGAFLDGVQLKAMTSAFKQFDSTESPYQPNWLSIIRNARNERDEFQSQMVETIDALQERIATNQEVIPPTFDSHWTNGRLHVVETFAELACVGQAGKLEKCKERGFEGLLEIRSIRLATLATLSNMYSELYNNGRQKRQSRPSDAADLRHAISASSADVFVTNDRRLQRQLSRIAIKNFQIIDLTSFLKSL